MTTPPFTGRNTNLNTFQDTQSSPQPGHQSRPSQSSVHSAHSMHSAHSHHSSGGAYADPFGNTRRLSNHTNLMPPNQVHNASNHGNQHANANEDKRIASESALDRDAYGYMQDYNPQFDETDTTAVQSKQTAARSSREFASETTLSTDDSLAKSGMSEASPEPEPKRSDDHDYEAQDYSNERKVVYLQKVRRALLFLVVALVIIFIGTLVALIVVAVKKNNPAPDVAIVREEAPLGDSTTPAASITTAVVKAKDPHGEYTFPHFTGSDPLIATAFADHSLYASFYGVTYLGPDSSSLKYSKIAKRGSSNSNAAKPDESPEIQHQVALDVALLSRVTPRIRLVDHSNFVTDRVIRAVQDLNINVNLVLDVNVDDWNVQGYDFRRILNSYPTDNIESIHVLKGSNSSEPATYQVFKEIQDFLARHQLRDVIALRVSQGAQANPLELAIHPKLAAEWINTDWAYTAYTNLETPSETSEKAQYMTSWVCGVVPLLRPGIEWYWPNAFDSESRGVDNAIFTEDRKIKPAGLPRCQDYRQPKA